MKEEEEEKIMKAFLITLTWLGNKLQDSTFIISKRILISKYLIFFIIIILGKLSKSDINKLYILKCVVKFLFIQL